MNFLYLCLEYTILNTNFLLKIIIIKKIVLILSVIFLIFINSNAQQVFSSSGDYFENSNVSVSWTIGEPIIETYDNGSNIITQGFQQSKLSAVSIFELKENGIKVNIAPNPTNDFIILSVNKFENVSYQLFDFNGKMIKESDVKSGKTQISFSGLSNAAYFLKILKGAKTINTFQVIKQ